MEQHIKLFKEQGLKPGTDFYFEKDYLYIKIPCSNQYKALALIAYLTRRGELLGVDKKGYHIFMIDIIDDMTVKFITVSNCIGKLNGQLLHSMN